MTPKEYKARYLNLQVPVEVSDPGNPTKTVVKRFPVQVDQYRLNGVNFKEAAKDEFWGEVQKLKGSIDVDPGTGSVSIDRDSLTKIFQLPFLGKGSPEHCQIILQLAAKWNLKLPSGKKIDSDPVKLQQYAKEYLGLDCNGFVGSYIWHDKKSHPWDDPNTKTAPGPEATIEQYFPAKRDDVRLVTDWDTLDISKVYIMGLADKNGDIVPRISGDDVAHIVITVPNQQRDSGDGHKDVMVVESTGGLKDYPRGLSENWYRFKGVKNGVFTIDRGDGVKDERRTRTFKIVAIEDMWPG
jgi:hypothetical protein